MVDVVKTERGSAASDAAIRVAAFLDLRNKRAEGAQENIASLVNDANCVLHLSAANIRTILTELEDLKALHSLTCQAVDKHKETIKAQAAEIERLRRDEILYDELFDKQQAEIERLRAEVAEFREYLSEDNNDKAFRGWQILKAKVRALKGGAS